jgi:hypothetical protein
LIIQTFNCLTGFLCVRHLNEAKTSGSVGFPIYDDVHLVDSAVLREGVTQIVFSGFERQVSNVNITHSQNPPISRADSTSKAEPDPPRDASNFFGVGETNSNRRWLTESVKYLKKKPADSLRTEEEDIKQQDRRSLNQSHRKSAPKPNN